MINQKAANLIASAAVEAAKILMAGGMSREEANKEIRLAVSNINNPVVKFEVGAKYSTRSVCDSDCVIPIYVVKRTAKTITLSNCGRTDMMARGKTLRVRVWEGVESVKPWGTYSMAPIVRAA